MTTCKLHLLKAQANKRYVKRFVYFYPSLVDHLRKQAIGSRCTLSPNHRASLAPPATSLAWRHVEQEFRLCDDDSVAEEITAVMTVVR